MEVPNQLRPVDQRKKILSEFVERGQSKSRVCALAAMCHFVTMASLYSWHYREYSPIHLALTSISRETMLSKGQSWDRQSHPKPSNQMFATPWFLRNVGHRNGCLAPDWPSWSVTSLETANQEIGDPRISLANM
jgi:hypothetical protein